MKKINRKIGQFNKVLFLIFILSFCTLQAQVDRSIMPETRKLKLIDVPEPVSFQLENGLHIIVVENHSLPKVEVSLHFNNKPMSQQSKVGVGALYAAMMGNGTLTMSKDMFHQRIDFVGARLQFTQSGAHAEMLAEFFPVVFRLLADGLLHPKFVHRDFEYQKQRLLQDIEATHNNVALLAEQLQRALTFGFKHPYGEYPTLQSVSGIKRSDLIAYYDKHANPNGAYMLISGDVQVEEVKTMAQLYYGVWQSSAVPADSLPEVPLINHTEIDFLNIPNAVQNDITVVNPIYLQKTDPDYLAALLANEILGGGSNGRLYLHLREAKGYTYQAYSSLESDPYVSAFEAHISVRNSVVDKAIDGLLKQIDSMRSHKVSANELALAKATIKGNFIRCLEQPQHIAQLAFEIDKDSLSPQFYQEFIQRIDTITAEHVQLAAQKYMRPDQARIIVVGNGRAVAQKLKTIHYNGQVIPVKYYNKSGELEKQLNYDNDVMSDVSKIYARYLKAIGGRTAVEAVHTVYAKYTGLLGAHSIVLIDKKNAKGQSSQEVLLNNSVIQKLVFDGNKGYVEVRDVKTPYTESENQAAQLKSKLFPELHPNPKAKILGIKPINGRMAYVVQRQQGIFDYYSVDTGLKLQSVQQTKSATATKSYADYQSVNGVKFPHTISQSFNNKTILFKIQELLINKEVSETDFQ